jgi:hypothetical protein
MGKKGPPMACSGISEQVLSKFWRKGRRKKEAGRN